MCFLAAHAVPLRHVLTSCESPLHSFIHSHTSCSVKTTVSSQIKDEVFLCAENILPLTELNKLFKKPLGLAVKKSAQNKAAKCVIPGLIGP